MLSRRLVLVPATLVVAVVALAFALAPRTEAQVPIAPGPGPQQGISTVGEGIVTATPNVARVTLGVEVNDATLSGAQSQASQRMDAVIQQLKSAGIADSDIRTVSYNISPQYDNSNNQGPTLRGYLVQNLVEVRVTQTSSLGQILDNAVSAGATRIYGIRFESDNPSALKDQARDQAMQNAREKADQMARAAGVSVGRPILIQENDASGATPVQAQPAVAQAAPAGVARATTPIQPGELQVRTTVHVVWAIQ